MHQIGGNVNVYRREGRGEKDVAHLVRRAEIGASLCDDASWTIGGMTATAVERLLETIDEEDAIRPRDPNHDRLINPLPDDIAIELGVLELPGDRPMALLLTDEK
jgi:hypothetical protein